MEDEYWKSALLCIDKAIQYIEEGRPVKSRESSLALTKLDEAEMWLKKGKE